jgi:hypothetical protein
MRDGSATANGFNARQFVLRQNYFNPELGAEWTML